tara:strand:+ start:77 stop:550 length:474 start_codon:yes stop_codon:yes gene_type:complete
MMIEKLKKLLASRKNVDDTADDEDLKLASAALLLEAACMDGHADSVEISTVVNLLGDQFNLNVSEASELVDAGRNALSDSVELYGFTRIIKNSFNHEDRVRMIEMLWKVVYADGTLHDFEANLVRRICGLIYVSDRESGEVRKRVLEHLDLDFEEIS